jgi:hypothetical protein
MHHIQKKIILTLTRKENARFAELRPKEIDGNIFTYHLKQLIADKLVQKTEDGNYKLTQKGKLSGINIQLSSKDELEQAHSVLFLAVQNSSGKWLLRKRLVHPAFGRIGFLHCEPTANENILTTAKRMLKERANLDGTFIVKGSGYIKLFRDGELESFTQFTMLYAKNATGKISSPGDSGQNFWYNGNFNEDEQEFFTNMPELMKSLQNSKGLFFKEINQEV